jgi:hypothetical protein
VDWQLLVLVFEDLPDGPAQDGANELREEGEDDGGVELFLGLVDVADVLVFEAELGDGYIF